MSTRRLVDIGANLTDKVFTGIYRGVVHHENDYQNVLRRARKCGVEKIIITGGSLADSAEAIALCETDKDLFCTVGCHPTRCLEFSENPDDYLMKLKNLILTTRKKVVAVGECGLDYDREEFCPRDVQKKYFDIQLKLASDVKLPMFLHCRAAHEDLLSMMNDAKERYFTDTPLKGVVHSFDGTHITAKCFIDMGLYIGINGCSLKNQANLEVVQRIPTDRLLLETDAPWCDIRRTHAGYSFVKTHPTYRKHTSWDASCMVKGRNEPANLVQVLEVVAGLKSMGEEELAEATYQNAVDLFSLPI
ncbi:unnamed protein product [Heterobilharzia americana]|nr:unnamed protein product [Heterobilharzia americana]CAH8560599.1 unnamed protein product [Heterobilharzia americana]